MTTVRPTQPPAAPEGEVGALREAIERGLRRCRVEDAPVPLIKEHDLFHVTHMVAAELAPMLEAARERVRVVEGERDAARVSRDDEARRYLDTVRLLQERKDAATARAESAEAALAELRAGVEALAEEWEADFMAYRHEDPAHLRIRALLAGDAR